MKERDIRIDQFLSVANKPIKISPFLPSGSFGAPSAKGYFEINEIKSMFCPLSGVLSIVQTELFSEWKLERDVWLEQLLILVNGKSMSMQRNVVSGMRFLRYTQNKLFFAAHI